MLEIIILIFLTRRIGAKAFQKRQPKGKWQAAVVFGWLGFEIFGGMIGYAISRQILLAAFLALACAPGGYLLAKYRLDQYPDAQNNDWADRIGEHDA